MVGGAGVPWPVDTFYNIEGLLVGYDDFGDGFMVSHVCFQGVCVLLGSGLYGG